MTIKILFDLHNKLQNLMMAGSKYASNNEQIKQYIPALNDMGKQTPIFGKLAKAIEKLTTSQTEDTALLLLTINNLLESILQTSGSPTNEIVEKKEFSQITSIEELQEDNFDLREAIVALRLKITGRPGIIKKAYDRKVHLDPRTFPYLALFLDRVFREYVPNISPRIEIVPFIVTKMIPEAGKRLIPLVLKHFEYVDVQRNIHRISALAELEYEGLDEIRRNIFDQKLPKLQNTLIEHTKPTPQNIEEIKAFSKDSNKDVRAGAYISLSKSEDPEVISYLVDCLSDLANYDVLAKSLSGKVLSQANTIKIIESLKTDFKSVDDSILFGQQIEMLHKNECDEVYAFFQRVINRLYEVNHFEDWYMMSIFNCLLQYNQDNVRDFIRKLLPEVMSAVLRELEGLKPKAFYYPNREGLSTQDIVIRMYFNFLAFSIKILPKKEVYETFSPLFLLLDKYIAFLGIENKLGSRLTGLFYDLFDESFNLQMLDPKFIENICKLFSELEGEEMVFNIGFLDRIYDLGEEYLPQMKSILINRFTFLDGRAPYFIKYLIKCDVPNWFDVTKTAITNTIAKYGDKMNSKYFHWNGLHSFWSSEWLQGKTIDFAHKFQELADMLDNTNEYKKDFLSIVREIKEEQNKTKN